MIELLISQFMPYLALIGVGIAAYFGVKSKVQSHTINKQEDAIETHKQNEVELKQAIQIQQETNKQVSEANEILIERTELDDAAARLRERASAGRDGDEK